MGQEAFDRLEELAPERACHKLVDFYREIIDQKKNNDSWMKKILFVNPASSISGAENYMLRLMVRLDPDRYQPYVACRGEGPLSELCKNRGIPVFYIGSFPKPGWSPLYTMISMLYNALRIALLVKKFRIDLVHNNSVRSAYFGGLGARLANKPSIIHVRDYHDSPFRSPAKAR